MKHIIEAAKQRLELSGISPIVYHLTTVNNLTSILKTNKFALTLEEALDIEDKWNGKAYFLSTMRTKYGKYQQGEVRLTLDGRKLGQRYKGAPVDYYGPNWRGADKGQYEQEDRVWHTKPYIDNAKKYIIEVDINIEYVKKQQLLRILAITRREKIVVNIYKNQRDYRLGKNALQGYEWIGEMMEMDTSLERKYSKGSSIHARNVSSWYFYIKGLKDFIESTPSESLSTYLKSTYGKNVAQLNQHYAQDIKGQLSADISNARTKKDPIVVYYMNKIHRLAKRKGFKVHQLHKYIIELKEKTDKIEQAKFYVERLQSFEKYYDALKQSVKKGEPIPDGYKMWENTPDYIISDMDTFKNRLLREYRTLYPDGAIYAKRLENKLNRDGHTSIEMAVFKLRTELFSILNKVM